MFILIYVNSHCLHFPGLEPLQTPIPAQSCASFRTLIRVATVLPTPMAPAGTERLERLEEGGEALYSV